MECYRITAAGVNLYDLKGTDLSDYYKALQCRVFDIVERQKDGDCIFVSDEGYFEMYDQTIEKPKNFGFSISRMNYVGLGLIVGTDEKGDTQPPNKSLDYYRACIRTGALEKI